jgi:hypothetical protein
LAVRLACGSCAAFGSVLRVHAAAPFAPMSDKLILLAAVLAFAFGCRTIHSRFMQKMAFIGYLAATYLVGYWLGSSHIAGAVAVLGWFLLPWLEITRLRSLLIPELQKVKSRFAPSREVFPELPELTEEAEAQGFEQKDDAGWSTDETTYFKRLMYHPTARTRVALCQASQGDFAVNYVEVSSRITDGRRFTTTNYPFPDSLRSAPDHPVCRFVHAESLEHLLVNHDDFMAKYAVEEDDLEPWDEETLVEDLTDERQRQVTHNLQAGYLERVDEQNLRYSWRGCFYLWFEVVKDMIRI